MIKRVREINVRNRIIILSAAVSIFFFVFTTPILAWIGALITPPNELQNIRVLASTSSLRLTWDEPTEIDIKSISISISEQSFELSGSETSFSKGLDGSIPREIKIVVKDNFGITNNINISLEEFNDQADLVDFTYNQNDNETRANSTVFRRSLLLGIILLIGTFAVLGFDVSDMKTMVLGFYPSAVVIPYLLLSYSFLISESYEFNKLILSIVFSLLLYIISYFVVLTTNILNTSINVKIPLEQAARASQFIFSLISSYLILILFFGASFNFFEKIVFIVTPIFYLTFSAILMLENVTPKQAIIRSSSITLALIYGIFVLSIWPINYVYAILTIAVCFYILLSVALEIRPKLSRHVWIEYAILISLVTFLLILNSNWGINGTII